MFVGSWRVGGKMEFVMCVSKVPIFIFYRYISASFFHFVDLNGPNFYRFIVDIDTG